MGCQEVCGTWGVESLGIWEFPSGVWVGVVGGLGWVGVIHVLAEDKRKRRVSGYQLSMGMLRSGIGTEAQEHAENKEGKGKTGTRRRYSQG